MTYQINPEKFNPDMEVSTCFIESEDEILLILRRKDKLYGGLWNVAGGKLDNGEVPIRGCAREVREETGLILATDEFSYFRSYNMRYPEFDFINHVFRTRFQGRPRTKVETKAHKQHMWTTPARALTMKLVPLEYEVIREVYGLNV